MTYQLHSALNLSDLQIQEPISTGTLTVVPLTRSDTREADYLTLEQALQTNSVEVTEVSDQGFVPELLLLNLGDCPVLLIDGEELIGAKQNRVLNLSVLAPAFERLHIPVSCIEQGRWHWRSRTFSAANRTLYASARASKMADVTREMRLSRQPHSDQLALWESIDRKSAAFQTRSPTRAASDIFDRSGLDLELMVTAVPVREDQIGAGFFINGKFKGIELFGEPKVFSKYIHKLIRSYGLDAIDPSAPRAGSTVDSESAKKKTRALLDKLQLERWTAHKAIGLGEDFRLQEDEFNGAALVCDEQLIHLTVFSSSL
jgi:hypothetical protein